MATRGPRVVAELGRPETPSETAARKAASSAAYRSSKTFRNLIVALVVTLIFVLIVVWGVPRGTAPEPAAIDPVSLAAEASASLDRTVIAPMIPEDWRVDDDGKEIENAWRVNQAAIGAEGGNTAWTVVTAPPGGYLRMSQGFDSDEAWARSVLQGQAPTDTVQIDGITWDRYKISNPEQAGNVSYALGTQAGTDYVLVYGRADEATTAQFVELISTQVRELQKEAS